MHTRPLFCFALLDAAGAFLCLCVPGRAPHAYNVAVMRFTATQAAQSLRLLFDGLSMTLCDAARPASGLACFSALGKLVELVESGVGCFLLCAAVESTSRVRHDACTAGTACGLKSRSMSLHVPVAFRGGSPHRIRFLQPTASSVALPGLKMSCSSVAPLAGNRPCLREPHPDLCVPVLRVGFLSGFRRSLGRVVRDGSPAGRMPPLRNTVCHMRVLMCTCTEVPCRAYLFHRASQGDVG